MRTYEECLVDRVLSEIEKMKTPDSLSVAASKAWRLCRDICESYDDPISQYYGFTPDFPYRLIERWERDTGWTVGELLKAVEERTSARWVHFSYLSMLSVCEEEAA